MLSYCKRSSLTVYSPMQRIYPNRNRNVNAVEALTEIPFWWNSLKGKSEEKKVLGMHQINKDKRRNRQRWYDNCECIPNGITQNEWSPSVHKTNMFVISTSLMYFSSIFFLLHPFICLLLLLESVLTLTNTRITHTNKRAFGIRT